MCNTSASLSLNDRLCITPSYKTAVLMRCIVQISLMLPLIIFVLYHGHQRWKPHRSLQNISHSDFFTYNMALAQLLNVLGTLLFTSGLFHSIKMLELVGDYLYGAHFIPELLIHCLTCLDRHLAVVTPIFYLKLKQSLGIMVRNVVIAVVWLLSVAYVYYLHTCYPDYPQDVYLFTLVFTFLIVAFCSIYILCILKRPGPGDKGEIKVDRSKLKAFQTIIAIMIVVFIWIVGIIICIVIEKLKLVSIIVFCIFFDGIIWLSIPSSIVLLGLYFRRARKRVPKK